MTTFTNGPAKGQNLMLKYSPALLRVTQHSSSGKWDALDAPCDFPSKWESIFVYRLLKISGGAFVDFRSKEKGGSYYPIANYQLVDPPPPDAHVRTNEAWAKWVQSQEGA